jgi:hypothetical protein
VNGLSFSSPFVESVFSLPPRPRSFAERTLDELTSMSGQQLLGLPLTAPITALGGAVRGVSFGLLDPTQEIAEGLGDFAPPQIARSALEIAGEIGGSFVPYIGAASIASKAFRGLDLSSKLLRGATTFGAPEVLRQALHGEFNPRGALRSLATGAAFSLPVGRALLTPAVFATTLATGGSLLEAGTAAGFAALFGPMQGTAKKAFGQTPAADGVTAQPGLRPEVDLSDFVALRKLKAARQASEAAPEFAEAPVGPLAEVRSAFARDDVLREGLRPRSQVELIQEAAQLAGGPPLVKKMPIAEVEKLALSQPKASPELVASVQAEGFREPIEIGVTASGRRIVFEGKHRLDAARQLGLTEVPTREVPIGPGMERLLERETTPQGEATATLASIVELLAGNSPEELVSGSTKAIEVHGPTSQQAKTVQLALAESKGGYVPGGAPVQNSLGTRSAGPELADPSPTSPIVQRLVLEGFLDKARLGDEVSSAQAAQLERLLLVKRARDRSGKPTDFAQAAEFMKQAEAVMAQPRITFRDDGHALETFGQELAQVRTLDSLAKFDKLPEHYANRGPEFARRAGAALADRHRIVGDVEHFAKELGHKAEEEFFQDYGLRVSTAPLGMSFLRTPTGQRVGPSLRGPDSLNRLRTYIKGLEEGRIPAQNLDEVRAIGNARGVIIEHVGETAEGQAILHIINNTTGELLDQVTSLPEAQAAVSRVTRAVLDNAPELLPGAPKVPGLGSSPGEHANEHPAACFLPPLLR